MTSAEILDKMFYALLGAVPTGALFMVKGGVRRGNAETDNAIINGIKEAGEFLAKSNEQLQHTLMQVTKEYEEKIHELENKFDLKEKSLLLKIENLELENKNLKLENANLILENNRLLKSSK